MSLIMTKEDQLAFTQYLRNYITPSKQKKVEQIVEQRTRYVAVVLENIFQAHNASAVVRTTECFGLQDIHLIENKYECNITNTIAMGASKWMSIQHHATSNECIDLLKKCGYRIIATTPAPHACVLPDLSVDTKMALFFGTENTGLSEYVLEHADEFVKIPMHGFTESFNISVSVGIFLQYIMTTLRASSLPWQLTESEKDTIRLEWFSRIVRASEQHKKLFFSNKKK